jgi:hypothetical protein
MVYLRRAIAFQFCILFDFGDDIISYVPMYAEAEVQHRLSFKYVR